MSGRLDFPAGGSRQSPSQRRRNLIVAAWAAVIVCSPLLAGVWCIMGGWVPLFSLRAVEAITGLRLPVGSELVSATYRAPASPWVTGVIDLPENGVHPFAAENPFATKEASYTGARPNTFARSIELEIKDTRLDWRLERINKLLALRGGRPHAVTTAVIDLDRPSHPRLFLVWAGD